MPDRSPNRPLELSINLPATPAHHYTIRIGHGLLDTLEGIRARLVRPVAVVVTNTTVAPLYLERVLAALHAAQISAFPIVLPDGERYKHADTLDQILSTLLERRVERDTTLIALGGGVIGDLTGFAASVYLRGVPYIQMPTTLLAQVDSSVGGKTAINHPLGKNMIGSFWQPCWVLSDLATLATLPLREYRAGLAEVIKYGIIGDVEKRRGETAADGQTAEKNSADHPALNGRTASSRAENSTAASSKAAFFHWLEKQLPALVQRDPTTLIDTVERSCRHKAAYVMADERESGPRALLNLGHTFAHAIETGQGYGVWLHGEAVAVGMVLAAQAAQRMGYLDATTVARIRTLLAALGLPTDPPAMPFETWMDLMSHDKKVSAGAIRFIVPHALGEAHQETIPDSVLRQILVSAG